jgi:hypothetical protein
MSVSCTPLVRAGNGPTGISPVETFDFLVELVKKSAQNTCFLIIYSTVLCKKIDYVGCLLHALLNYLIFCAIFSKNYFSPDFSPVGHLFPTGSSSAPSLFYIQPPKAATLATVIYLE